jgi:hypothetical protein
MYRKFMIGTVSALFLALSPTLFGQQPDHGTADQAKAMLLKAVAAVKADKTKALNIQHGTRWVPGPRPLCFLLKYGWR